MSFKLQCQGKNPIKQTDHERLAEIKLTRDRLNNKTTEQDTAKKLASNIKDMPKQQMQGSSGSLGLIMGGGFGSIGNLVKNVFKQGSKKVLATEVNDKL